MLLFFLFLFIIFLIQVVVFVLFAYQLFDFIVLFVEAVVIISIVGCTNFEYFIKFIVVKLAFITNFIKQLIHFILI